jgi:hypothetical protein
MSDDEERRKSHEVEWQIRDAIADLTAAELAICRAYLELVRIEMKLGPLPPAQQLEREAKLIAAWSEACRRAGVPVIELPAEVLHAITAMTGRAS